MGVFVSEYFENVTVTPNEWADMIEAQGDMYNYGIKVQDYSTLTSVLGGVTTVLGFFSLPTPIGVANTIAGLITTLSFSEKDALDSAVKNGVYWMATSVQSFMKNHPQYDLYEIKVPILDYNDTGIRFVQGNGAILRAHSGSGWTVITPEI